MLSKCWPQTSYTSAMSAPSAPSAPWTEWAIEYQNFKESPKLMRKQLDEEKDPEIRKILPRKKHQWKVLRGTNIPQKDNTLFLLPGLLLFFRVLPQLWQLCCCTELVEPSVSQRVMKTDELSSFKGRLREERRTWTEPPLQSMSRSVRSL